jgi:hypothetical protein
MHTAFARSHLYSKKLYSFRSSKLFCERRLIFPLGNLKVQFVVKLLAFSLNY